MGTIGTFDSFTTARLGIYAAQHGLRVTGNNIANINTYGYTRQRLDQVSFKAGSHDMYASQLDNHVGSGALVTGINQVRDPYLDIRYRNTASKVGYNDTFLAGLKEIQDTLDEVGKYISEDKKGDGILNAQLQDLRDMLQRLNSDPTKANDVLVRNSAETLCSIFHQYANALETLRQNTHDSFKEEVSSVNEILTNIRNLNETIRQAEIHGDNALEMRDERNRQIDALSEYMQIKVEYTMEDIGAGLQVEKLTISLGNANPDPLVDTDETVLIDGIYGAQLSIRQEPKLNPNYDPNLPFTATNLKYLDKDGNPCKLDDPNLATEDNPNYDLDVSRLVDSRGRWHPEARFRKSYELDDNDLYGSLQAIRELLTESGEFATTDTVANVDESASIKRGIPYFQKSLDLLAREFAKQYNSLNQGFVVDEDGKPVTTVTGTAEELGLRRDEDGYYIDADGYYVPNTDHGTCVFSSNTNPDTRVKAGLTDQEKQDILNDPDKNPNGHATWKEYMDYHGANDPETKVTLTAHPENVDDQGNQLGVKLGGVLFSNSNKGDDPSDITAANIDVSHSWSTGDLKIIPTFIRLHDGTISNTTKQENIGHMISKVDEPLLYNPQDLVGEKGVSTKLFKGSFNDMFNNMGSVLGNDQRITNVQLNTEYTRLVEIDTSRDGVSGVDLNDEAMNMMQFQKAYSAACRLMTAIDEAIDRLINNTGLAGR